LTQKKECKALIDGTIERYGHIDILVNNAGIQHIDPIDKFPEGKWEKRSVTGAVWTIDSGWTAR
jgi:3-hydroxybutyrate dehydrogenase